MFLCTTCGSRCRYFLYRYYQLEYVKEILTGKELKYLYHIIKSSFLPSWHVSNCCFIQLAQTLVLVHQFALLMPDSISLKLAYLLLSNWLENKPVHFKRRLRFFFSLQHMYEYLLSLDREKSKIESIRLTIIRQGKPFENTILQSGFKTISCKKHYHLSNQHLHEDLCLKILPPWSISSI